jgi:hypothetical protein
MTKKRKKQTVQSVGFDVAVEAAFVLAEHAIKTKRKNGEEYPPEWEDPEFIRNNIAPALLNKMLERLPLINN